jgi:SAM-dependent methyltransferase
MPDHVSYLTAKRAVDDRALNRDVLAAFADALPAEPTVLEVGCGTATMPERLFEWGVVEAGRWIAVDTHPEAIEAARERLATRDDAVREVEDGAIRIGDLAVETARADAFEYASRLDERVDAVVGSAFFDIVDVPKAVSAFGAVTDLVYAPITYDGATTFVPADAEDDAVLERYHEHMRSRRPGGPDGGRRLRSALASVEAAGASPWAIEPPYTVDERTVIEHVLRTIDEAVAEMGYDAGAWVDRRRRQLDAGGLRYRAANVDLLGRLGETSVDGNS